MEYQTPALRLMGAARTLVLGCAAPGPDNCGGSGGTLSLAGIEALGLDD